MSSSHVRKPLRSSLTASAVLAGSVAATLAGIGTASAGPKAPSAPSGPANSALLISNGTATVNVVATGGGPVTFGSTVKDAAPSPDGSRVAYIDGGGNLATSTPTGDDVLVLTTAAAGTVRSRPAWEDGGSEIVFTEQVGAGIRKLMTVDASGLSMGKPAVEVPLGETAGDTTSDDYADAYFSAAVPGFGGHLSKLVYQHAGQTPEIWILDRNTRGPAGSRLLAGSQPSLSPDATKLAFIDNATGQVEIADLPIPSGGAPTITAITNSATTHFSNPTWSPDGHTLAFQALSPGATPADPYIPKDVETAPAAGGTAPTVVQNAPGVPAYMPLNKHHVDRIKGDTRYGTAIAASQSHFATSGSGTDPRQQQASSVVLSRSDQFADALGGSSLADRVNGPLLLTPSGSLDVNVQKEIIRVLGPANPQYTQNVYLLGGLQALSPAVETAVRNLGYNVVRLSGPDRYATSVAIADFMTTNSDGSRYAPQQIMVATGANFADALSAGAAAGGQPVVLTADKVMPQATATFLNHYHYDGGAGSVPVYAIGGQANTALKSVGFGTTTRQYTPVFGSDRYATSTLVAKTFFDGPAKVGFATGLNWADALSGGATMGALGGPLILVDPVNGPNAETTTWLKHTGPQPGTALIFGGSAAVSPDVDQLVGLDISGAAGFDQAVNPQNVNY